MTCQACRRPSQHERSVQNLSSEDTEETKTRIFMCSEAHGLSRCDVQHSWTYQPTAKIGVLWAREIIAHFDEEATLTKKRMSLTMHKPLCKPTCTDYRPHQILALQRMPIFLSFFLFLSCFLSIDVCWLLLLLLLLFSFLVSFLLFFSFPFFFSPSLCAYARHYGRKTGFLEQEFFDSSISNISKSLPLLQSLNSHPDLCCRRSLRAACFAFNAEIKASQRSTLSTCSNPADTSCSVNVLVPQPQLAGTFNHHTVSPTN